MANLVVCRAADYRQILMDMVQRTINYITVPDLDSDSVYCHQKFQPNESQGLVHWFLLVISLCGFSCHQYLQYFLFFLCRKSPLFTQYYHLLYIGCKRVNLVIHFLQHCSNISGSTSDMADYMLHRMLKVYSVLIPILKTLTTEMICYNTMTVFN